MRPAGAATSAAPVSAKVAITDGSINAKLREILNETANSKVVNRVSIIAQSCDGLPFDSAGANNTTAPPKPMSTPSSCVRFAFSPPGQKCEMATVETGIRTLMIATSPVEM